MVIILFSNTLLLHTNRQIDEIKETPLLLLFPEYAKIT